MKDTKPFFIISSGRSGTQMMTKIFNEFHNVEMNHEYMVNIIQPIASQYYMGMVTKELVCKKLRETYQKSIFYSEKEIWGDSSNKLSWIIDCLNDVFPDAKFIHLVRDGRKVVSSFYHKLGNECYDDKSVKILKNWINEPEKFPKPPPEKKYWWNIPVNNEKEKLNFEGYDQFERICFHWKDVNENIMRNLANIPNERKRFYRLEDLVSDSKNLKDFLKFLGLEFNESIFQLLKKPHNVNIAKDFPLTDDQKNEFVTIAGSMMKKLGYNTEKEYLVDYKGDNPIKFR
jgi:hypothetical protein